MGSHRSICVCVCVHVREPRLAPCRLQPRPFIYLFFLLLIALVKKRLIIKALEILLFFFKTVNKPARPREHSGRPADTRRPDCPRGSDSMFVCV